MGAKNKYSIFNFGNNDRNVQIWRSFEVNGNTYELDHLNAAKVEYTGSSEKTYTVYVTYSHHCFAKDDPDLADSPEWIYPYEKDPRHFHLERYELSFNLPTIVNGLMDAVTFHAGYESFAVCSYPCRNGQQVHYKVAFTVFRSNKKLRLHISSAYPVDKRPKIKKVKMERILDNVLKGKPVPKPQA